jgi:chromatin remodeling complex protein RSC6
VERIKCRISAFRMRISGSSNTISAAKRLTKALFIEAMAVYQRGRVVEDGAALQRRKENMAKSATKAASAKAPRKPNPALMKPLTPSPELAAVVGSAPLPRPEVVSKVWEYIKKNKLQDEKNKREINADSKLEKVFGKKKVTMFEMNKHLAAHLK